MQGSKSFVKHGSMSENKIEANMKAYGDVYGGRIKAKPPT